MDWSSSSEGWLIGHTIITHHERIGRRIEPSSPDLPSFLPLPSDCSPTSRMSVSRGLIGGLSTPEWMVSFDDQKRFNIIRDDWRISRLRSSIFLSTSANSRFKSKVNKNIGSNESIRPEAPPRGEWGRFPDSAGIFSKAEIAQLGQESIGSWATRNSSQRFWTVSIGSGNIAGIQAQVEHLEGFGPVRTFVDQQSSETEIQPCARKERYIPTDSIRDNVNCEKQGEPSMKLRVLTGVTLTREGKSVIWDTEQHICWFTGQYKREPPVEIRKWPTLTDIFPPRARGK